MTKGPLCRLDVEDRGSLLIARLDGGPLAQSGPGLASAPTALGGKAAEWLARDTGGIAQSNVLEALGNIPTAAHILGGAVIGADANSGVVDQHLRVHGYENLLVCDGAAMPEDPGVNPALTITVVAEYATAQIPKGMMSGARAMNRDAPDPGRRSRC